MLTIVALAVLAGGILLFRAGVKIFGALIGVVGFVLLAAVVLLTVLGEPYRIPGESMAATLEVGDRVVAVDVGEPAIGDIAILNPPAGAEDGRCGARPREGAMCARPTPERSQITFVERIVALAGDKVTMKRGVVIRDGQPLAEPYARPCTGAACEFPVPITVPRGHVLALGDNRGASDDGRFWGPVPVEWVKGHVVGRYWPLKRAGRL